MLTLVDAFYENSQIAFEFLALNSIYSALLALLVLTLKLIIPRLPRSIEYGLWCLVLVRLVLPTDFSVIYSLGYLGNLVFETQLPIMIKNTDWLTQFGDQKIFSNEDSTLTWMKLWLIIWAAFSVFVAIKYLRLKIKLSNLLAEAHPVEEEWLTRIVNRWRMELGIRRQIIVIDSNDFLSPFTFGIMSPVIFLPEQLLKEKRTEIIEPIIAHELAHVSRLDAVWLAFQNFLQIIYCLNPLLWLVVGRLSALREEICDHRVLGFEKLSNQDYGKSLLRVLRLNIGDRTPENFATFFLSHKQVFKKRIEAIGVNQSRELSPIKYYGVLAFSFLFFLPMGWQKAVEKPPLERLLPVNKISSPFPERVRINYQPPVLLGDREVKKVSSKKDTIEIESSK